MTKHTAKFVGIAISALIGTVAWAGAKNTNTVLVNTVARTASGSLGDARNTADTQQFIGCGITTYVGSAPTVACFAMDTSSNYVGCSSTNADLLATAQSINGDSYITFTWDAFSGCTSLSVTNASLGAPKQP
ncbi:MULTISPECIES: hypothetical protein [Myxococcus]|uniref:hypothetical protein n=1 Tax=Myxococcus TaxID=32 RepID=UPI0013D7CBC8|nr:MULTISPECIES: hypothetical protein [Myxococcus]NVJ21308.1 hypothetical protein [Myxococcus sp. AM011]